MIDAFVALCFSFVVGPQVEGEEAPAVPRGLAVREAGAVDGLTLIAPLDSTKVHLVDLAGEVVHTWETHLPPGGAIEFTPSGTLLHSAREDDTPIFHGGGLGGHLREFDWDGNVVWHYELHGPERQAHHDFEVLPNGNVLLIAWEHHSREEAIAHGRDEDAVGDEGLWADVVLEIEPTRPQGGRVVWEWRTFDHLVQDRDPTKPGFGSVPALPGRIDVNGDHRDRPAMTDEERDRLEKLEADMAALGYTGGAPKKKPTKEERKAAAERKRDPDWLHTNAVAFHPALDLIVLSTPRLNELWVIDHSTSTEEARGTTGGRYGRGGEILWRWGNPRVHGAGTDDDRRLFFQHDPRFVTAEDGAPDGELRLTVFNNGGGRKGGDYSTVEELVLPFDAATGFASRPGAPFGPAEPAWTYEDRPDFYSGFISGATRLPGGNTLVCEGAEGRVFEVTRDGAVVWDFRHELGGDVADHGRGGKAPRFALFRAQRVARTHPGLPAELRADAPR